MTIDEIKAGLEKQFGDKIKDLTTDLRRIFFTVSKDDLVEVSRFLHQAGFTHMSTITGRDTGTEILALYHFALPGVVLTMRVATDRQNPTLPTLTGVFPGAVLYERELHDILGIRIEGHPDLRPLVLPDDWPAGVYPLRKDWKYDQDKGVIE